VRQQHLDFYGHQRGNHESAVADRPGDMNVELSVGVASAANDAQLANWTARDPRLKIVGVVPYEDGVASAAEVRKRAGNKDFAQVFMLSRPASGGPQALWPIYEAAVEAGLPVGIHAFGLRRLPMSSSGYPSFYIEEMTSNATRPRSWSPA